MATSTAALSDHDRATFVDLAAMSRQIEPLMAEMSRAFENFKDAGERVHLEHEPLALAGELVASLRNARMLLSDIAYEIDEATGVDTAAMHSHLARQIQNVIDASG